MGPKADAYGGGYVAWAGLQGDVADKRACDGFYRVSVSADAG